MSKVRDNHRKVANIRANRGTLCFYCGLPMGSDRTIEHLVTRLHLGSDHIDNLAFAHKACNQSAGSVHWREKVKNSKNKAWVPNRNCYVAEAVKLIEENYRLKKAAGEPVSTLFYPMI